MKSYDLVIHPSDAGSMSAGPIWWERSTAIRWSSSRSPWSGLLEDQGIHHIHLSLEQLTFISSAGISALMHLTHRLRQRTGELVLVKPSEKVHRVFKTLGFTNISRLSIARWRLTRLCDDRPGPGEGRRGRRPPSSRR